MHRVLYRIVKTSNENIDANWLRRCYLGLHYAFHLFYERLCNYNQYDRANQTEKTIFLVIAYDERNEEKLSDLSPLQSSRKREKDMRHIIVRSACSLNTFVMRAKHHYLCMKRFAFPAILFSDKTCKRRLITGIIKCNNTIKSNSVPTFMHYKIFL